MNFIRLALGAMILIAGVLIPAAKAEEVTPLPKDLKILAPDTATPSEVAAFSGKWTGRWEGMLDSTLVVTKIYPDKKGGWRADVVYSWGTYSGWRIDRAGYREYDGELKNGTLMIQSGRLVITYRLSDDRKTLEGTWNATRGDYKGAFARADSQ